MCLLQLLGVVPRDGLCEFGLYDIPNRDLFHNIEHTFGTYVKSVLTRGIGDCWGLDINKPVLDGIETHGSYKTFFYVCPLFTVTLTFNSIDAAEKFSGEVIIRPDWKTDDTEELDDIPVNSEPEPELTSEYDTKDYTIKCSKKLLTDIYKKQGSNQFIHVYRRINGSRLMWSVLASLPKYRTAFTIDLSDRKYTNAKALAVYAAYLFEKLAYGDNFPNTEYNRKLDVIKTLSTEDIEFVNEMVAPKLEKVYTILKELASDKPAESNEPLIGYEIGRSKDAVFEQIKQAPLKDDALETAAVDDELFAERFKRIEIPERNKLAIQQAISEIGQKPSIFQRIKNWFTN